MLYLGKRYYVKVIPAPGVKNASVVFNQSSFKIYINPDSPDRNLSINKALEQFSREKARIKITPRINKWAQLTGLNPKDIKFRKLSKRWGSCSNSNEIIINVDAVKLPFSLIDYIIIHELTHIKHKDHSKEFYREVAKFIPDWKSLDEKISGMDL